MGSNTRGICVPPCMCAGCNMQDELFASFEQVLALADKRGEPYARYKAGMHDAGMPANSVHECMRVHGRRPPTSYNVWIRA